MYDVTIFGAGIFGLSIAVHMLEKGARVQVIDPNGPGYGASGGIVGALAPHVPENWNEKKEFQFQSLIYARDFWRRTEAQTGKISSYAPLGRWQPILEEHQIELAQQRAVHARSLWQGQAQWQVIDQAPDHPLLPDSPTGHYIFDTLTAQIFPQRAIHVLAQAVKNQGGVLRTEGRSKGVIVDATGYWGLLKLSEELGKMVGNGVKGQAALLDFDARGTAQVFADALHIIPHYNGTVAVGSTSEREFEGANCVDDQVDDLLLRAGKLIPALQQAATLKKWAGVRPRAKTRAPMFGPHPDKQNYWIANGGFKIGLGIAPLVGQMMAEAVLEGRDVIPPPFLPSASLNR